MGAFLNQGLKIKLFRLVAVLTRGMQKSEEGIAERGNRASRSHQKTVRIGRILGLEDHLFLWLFDGVLETSHPYHMVFVFAGAKGHHTKVSMV